MPVESSTAEVSEKHLAYRALERMPESATLEQISEELAILAAIRRGERAAEEGRVVSHEEVARRSASWTGK
jgi:predicted transcriptional regulator